MQKADAENLRKFAAALFKEGWEFSVAPSYTYFTKGTLTTGQHRLTPPEKHFRGQKDLVQYSYRKILTSTPGGLSRSTQFSTVIDIDYHDYMLEELKEIMSVKRD